MTDADRARRLYGTAAAPAPHRVLRAGPLEARLEGGNLRYVRYDGHEVLRAISYIVRDRDWGTLTAAIDDLAVDQDEAGFRVAYRATVDNDGARLACHAVIEGTAEGRLRFTVEAVPDGDFETNRCGFNVLHPIDGVAGAPVTLERCDGTVEETRFPELIEPWQPFKTIRALTHRPATHLTATCRFEGDVFEMEDQRNWSDASYKTYVRPLELPWPYVMPAGLAERQSIVLDVAADAARRAPPRRSPGAPVRLELGAVTETRFPRVGLVVAPDEVAAARESAALLAEVAPQTLLCHFDPTAGHDERAMKDFAALQAVYPRARYELEYVVACTGELDAEFSALARAVRAAGLRLDSVSVCPAVDRQSTPPGSAWPECPPLEAVYAAARAAFPGLALGGGMFSYFTELNRKRPPLAPLDFVTHGTNPIVHAADDESVMETLETLPHITRSARAVIGADKPYRLGPATIAMRQNPYGSRTFDNPLGERICMANDDPRQRGLFAAAWTLGYAARIAPAAIACWVPAAFTGPRGLIDRAGGGLLPVGRTVAALAALAGGRVVESRVDEARRMAALAVETGDGRAVIAANLTAYALDVEFDGAHALQPFEVRRF